jgi:LysR family glycine cleavage system transcriptional activator
MVPLCSPTLVEGKHPLRKPADLVHHTLLHDVTPSEDLPRWEAWLAAAGVAAVPARKGTHFNSVQLVLQAAMEGQGVALGIDVLAAEDVSAGRLVVPFDVRISVDSAYYLVTLEETAKLSRVAAFRRWILCEAETFREQFSEPGSVGGTPAARRRTRARQ